MKKTNYFIALAAILLLSSNAQAGYEHAAHIDKIRNETDLAITIINNENGEKVTVAPNKTVSADKVRMFIPWKWKGDKKENFMSIEAKDADNLDRPFIKLADELLRYKHEGDLTVGSFFFGDESGPYVSGRHTSIQIFDGNNNQIGHAHVRRGKDHILQIGKDAQGLIVTFHEE